MNQAAETFQHQLQRFDPGIVWLDADNCVAALNGVAMQVLGANAAEVIGRNILQFHPEKSRAKVQWLLETSACPVDSSPPMTMMINIPDRVLLIKVSKMMGDARGAGTCMVFFDLTGVTTTPRVGEDQQGKPRLLFKLPVYKNNKVLLVDLDEVVRLQADGHYTMVCTRDDEYLCNLSLSDLELRLGEEKFIRVHRSHMINIGFASEFQKSEEQYAIVMEHSPAAAIPVSRGKARMLKEMLGLA
jgi:hypothetical protein